MLSCDSDLPLGPCGSTGEFKLATLDDAATIFTLEAAAGEVLLVGSEENRPDPIELPRVLVLTGLVI